MSWKLFLDDIREPSFEGIDPSSVVVARSYMAALREVEARGFPSFMYLDYHLGVGEPTVLEFLDALKARHDGEPIPGYQIISSHPNRHLLVEFMEFWRLEAGQADPLAKPQYSVDDLPVGTSVQIRQKGRLVPARILGRDDRGRYHVRYATGAEGRTYATLIDSFEVP